MARKKTETCQFCGKTHSDPVPEFVSPELRPICAECWLATGDLSPAKMHWVLKVAHHAAERAAKEAVAKIRRDLTKRTRSVIPPV